MIKAISWISQPKFCKYNLVAAPAKADKASQELKDSDVKVCTVIGFPLGANTSDKPTKIL